VTISIGVASRQSRNESPDDVLKFADEALYKAKGGGRNRVSLETARS
jgi:two-component system cell cycle response regulator